MKHILFNNETTIDDGNSTSYADVDENKIALFNADTLSGGSLSLTAAATGVSNFVIVQGGPGNSVVFRTPILERSKIERVRTVAAATPAAQLTTLSGFPTPVVGEEYTIKVVDVTNGYEPYPVQSVSVTATTTTTGDLLNALRDGINNHPRSLVTAAVNASTLELTGAIPSLATQEGIHTDAAPLAQSFSTSLSSNLDVVTIGATTVPTFGSGSYNQVRYLEENAQAGQGFLYRMTPFQAEKPVFFANSGLTYDLVSILYRTNTTPNISSSNKYVEYILAYNNAIGTKADWETVLG